MPVPYYPQQNTRTHIHTHTYIHTQLHTGIYVNMCMCGYVQVYEFSCVCVCVRVRVCEQVCVKPTISVCSFVLESCIKHISIFLKDEDENKSSTSCYLRNSAFHPSKTQSSEPSSVVWEYNIL